MVGVAAECAAQHAKSSHTAVSKSSQLGQRRLASPPRRNPKGIYLQGSLEPVGREIRPASPGHAKRKGTGHSQCITLATTPPRPSPKSLSGHPRNPILPAGVHDLTGISTSCNVEHGEDVSVYPIGAPLCRLMQPRPCAVWKIKSVDSVLTLSLQKTTRKSGPFWLSSRTRCTRTLNAFDRVFPTIQSSLNDAPETRFQKTRDSFSALEKDGRYWAQPLLAFDAA
jgi:hypothetical protein